MAVEHKGKSTEGREASRRKPVDLLARWLPHFLLFLLGFAYLWLVVEPHLIYPCFGTILPDAPPFVTGWPFLRDALSLPGGFVAYVAGFLGQGYCLSWLGALIILSSALCLCDISRRHLAKAGYAKTSVLSLFPTILLFLMYSRYKHPLPASLAVTLGLWCSLAFERLPWRRWAIRMPAYCVAATVVFWLAGAGGLALFAFMTVIYGLLGRDLPFSVAVLPASLALIWGLALYVFLLPPQKAFLVLTPLSPAVTDGMKTFSKVLTVLLYAFIPLGVSLGLLGGMALDRLVRTRKKPARTGKAQKGNAAVQRERLSWPLLQTSVRASVPIALLAAGLYVGRDPMIKTFLLSHDYSLRRQWDKVLELGRSLPPGESNVYVNHDIMRALYHTGRLPHDLFNFPLTPHGLFLTHEPRVSYLTQLKLCDIYLELGLVNLAEKLASEILATRGHCGSVVEKMAWINVLKNQTDTARIYLNVLKKDLVYRGAADALLHALDEGFTPEQTAYVNRVRSCMPGADHPGTGKNSIEKMLTDLLDLNPRNRMAFEYLMAFYLLTGQVEKVVANAGRLADLGDSTIPTPYEEAMLIYFGSHGGQIDRTRFPIRPQTIERYTQFLELRNATQPQNRQAVLNRMILEFGHSYFFYHTFGRVGVAGKQR